MFTLTFCIKSAKFYFLFYVKKLYFDYALFFTAYLFTTFRTIRQKFVIIKLRFILQFLKKNNWKNQFIV